MKPKPHLIPAAVIALGGAVYAANTTPPKPGLPPQTREQIQAHFAARKQRAQEAAAEAKASAAAEKASADHFYTGKPYDAAKEGYTFLFRSYDPELGRWSVTDPSGFPDGANQHRYACTPVNRYDSDGLAARTTVSNLGEAWEHWSSNAGGTVSATDSVDAEILGYSAYSTREQQLMEVWAGLLNDVSKGTNHGIISRPGTTWGVPGGTQTVGSVDLTFPGYQIDWQATDWDSEGKRDITGTATLDFSYNDWFDFQWDPSDPIWTFFTDVIPGLIAGPGTGFFISGSFSDTFTHGIVQYE